MMRIRFSFDLGGRDWLRLFFPAYVAFVACEIALILVVVIAASVETAEFGDLVGAWLSYFALAAALVVGSIVFQVMASRRFVPAIYVGGEALTFTREVKEALRIAVIGMLLSAFTVGFYGPWFVRRLTAYFYTSTELRGSGIRFRGKRGRLLAICILASLLGTTCGVIGAIIVLPDAIDPRIELAILTVGTWIVILKPCLHLITNWYCGFEWRRYRVYFKGATFGRSCAKILTQALLTVLTVGVYFPAAAVRLIEERWFMSRLRLEVHLDSAQKTAFAEASSPTWK